MNFEILDQSGADLTALKEARLKNSLQFEREKTALKYYLLGKGYHQAIKALGFIERIEFRTPTENQFRKDGITPSLHHQIRIALSITQLPSLSDILEEQAILNALLHDCQEDHDISSAEIEAEFGKATAEINWKLTKKFAGTTKNKEEYIREIAQDLVSSITKGKDRKDNLQHMIGVFSIDKMEQYTDEAEDVFLPMVKTASKLFPEVHQALMVISLELKMQIEFSRQYVELAREKDTSEKQVEGIKNDCKILTKENEKYSNQVLELSAKLKETGGISFNQAKRVYIKISNEMTRQLNTESVLSIPDVTKFLTEISVDLGVTAFDLVDYPSDQLSASPESKLEFNVDAYANSCPADVRI